MYGRTRTPGRAETGGDLEPIPSPPRLPLVGNLPSLRSRLPVLDLAALARRHGPIYELRLPRRGRLVVVSSLPLVNEVCDDSRFDKAIGPALRHLRVFATDGLFTAPTSSPSWRRAHALLMPHFNAQALRGYLPQMWEVAEQLLLAWERPGPDEDLDVPGDCTRLALDTIALCGFHHRFHSFSREGPSPFAALLQRVLDESQARIRQLPLVEPLRVRAHRRHAADVAGLRDIIDRIIRQRREQGPGEHHDVLDSLLRAGEAQGDERLEEEDIRSQVLTLLAAGYETTSSLLAFTLAALARHPDVHARARDEADAVLGEDVHTPPTPAQLGRLTYVKQVLEEALRLWPPVPFFQRRARAPTVIGGRYALRPEQEVLVLTWLLHRDPTVWGETTGRFDPERFRPEEKRGRPAGAFRAFGTGARACIGRQFAMQEATLLVGKLLQRFDLVARAPMRLDVRQSLTLKPVGLRLRVRRRAPPRRAAPAGPPRPGRRRVERELKEEGRWPSRLHPPPSPVAPRPPRGAPASRPRTRPGCGWTVPTTGWWSPP